MDTNTSSKAKPAFTIREDNVKASIWLNQSEKGDFYNVTLSRVYKEEDGTLKDTHSMGKYDLIKVRVAVQKAETWILTQSDE